MPNKLRKISKKPNKGTVKKVKDNSNMKTETKVYDIPNMKIIRLNRDVVEEEIGYRPFTSFFEDFSIADILGEEAILDTYRRCLKEWKHNVYFITELVMVLGWKSAQHYKEGNDRYCGIYCELFYKADRFALNTFEGEALDYYISTTD